MRGHIIHAVVPDPEGRNPKLRRLLVISVPSVKPGFDFDAVALSTQSPLADQLDHCVFLDQHGNPQAKLTKDAWIKCYWHVSLKLSDIDEGMHWGFVRSASVLQSIDAILADLLSDTISTDPGDE